MDSYGIDKDAPIIWMAQWDHYHALGWRWECNLPVGRRNGNALGIRALQRRHGEKNVTIGHPMDREGCCPYLSDTLIGVYVCDVEELVKALYDWMSNRDVV